jgi:ribonuclease HII
MDKLIVGVDEVGRGAVAGPLVVGASIGYWNKKNRKFLKGIRDSKKLTFHQREERFLKFKKGEIKFYTVEISNKLIDKNGMGWALKKAVVDVLKKIHKKIDLVYLDGGLHAPEKYKQKTIIKGDDKIPMISAASVYAKVYRDHLMMKMDKKYPYDFKIHKGYGTRAHFNKIRENGISVVHRKSFLKNLTK